MAACPTRRTLLRGLAPLGYAATGAARALAQPQHSGAKVRDGDYFSPLMPLVENRTLMGKGSLLLAPVDEPALFFVSDHRHVSETLWKPGSLVKPFLLEYLLEHGLLRDEERHPCPGGALPFAGRRLDCSHAPQPGPLDPATALALSCNRCFLHWAERLLRPGRRDAFANALRLAGFSKRQWFGQQTAAAQVSSPRSREAVLLQSLGESDIVTTPLAVLGAYQAFLRRVRDGNNSIGPLRMASPTLLSGMSNCIRAGTGIEAQVPGLYLGGKTGTGTSPDRRSLHGWMVSYWPVAAPRLVMVVLIEHGRGGVEAAAVTGEAWRRLQRAGLVS